METYRTHNRNLSLSAMLKNHPINRGATWGMMIIGALLAFEIFNYSTTEFALRDVLGDLHFIGIRWATILAIAFCGIDFAGIARLFTPEQGRDEPAEVWYLFGAWLLAAAMNASLTWWGVSIAIVNHSSLGSAVVSSTTLTKVVPIFVAVMVWLIRVLIIGSFSMAGDRLFSQGNQPRFTRPVLSGITPSQHSSIRPSVTANHPAQVYQPASKPLARSEPVFPAEPTYHKLVGARCAQETIGDRPTYNVSGHNR